MVFVEDKEFSKKVKELSGEDVTLCFQCGMCSSSCPTAHLMDVTPRKMVRLIQLGKEEILNSKTMWLCLSCFTCVARCPKNIDLAKIGEALRQIRLRKGLDYVNISEIPKEELEKFPQIALISCFRKFTS